MKKIVFIFLSLIVVFSCSEPQTAEGKKKKTVDPKTAIIEAGNKSTALYSLLAAKDHHSIYNDYFNGKKEDDFHNIQSINKSIVALLIGIAIDQKFIKTEDETIEKYFPNFFKNDNSKKSSITIRDLLNHTSGLEWEGHTEFPKWQSSPDLHAYVLNKTLKSTPGEVYNYNSGAHHLLSPILEKATGMSLSQFAYMNLFNPMGITRVEWKKMRDRFYDASGLHMKMRSVDLMKIGDLLLRRGKYGSQTLISEKWIDKIFAKENKKKAHWGIRNSMIGYGWYGTKIGNHLVHYAMGYGGQFLVVIPSKQMTIVANQNHNTKNGIEQSSFFIENILIPMVSSE